MPAAEYFRHKKSLIPDILRAYDSLAEELDIIVIEGAGSPAEINLKADDIVNMGLAKLVDAPVLLAGISTGAACLRSCTARWSCWSRTSGHASKGLSSTSSGAMWRSCAPALPCWKKNRSCRCWALCRTWVDIEDEDSLPPAGSSSAVKPLDRRHSAAAAYLQFHRFYAAGAAPAAERAVRASPAGAGRAGCGHSARHEKHGGRSALAASVRAGSCCAESWQQAARRCWAYAAATRCWARRWPTPRAPRADARRPLRGLGLLPTRLCLPPKSAARRTPPRRCALCRGQR